MVTNGSNMASVALTHINSTNIFVLTAIKMAVKENEFETAPIHG
jgi:hypothetical protein